MSFKTTLAIALCTCSVALAEPATTDEPIRTPNKAEQDAVNSYLKKTEKKHKHRMGWASFNFGLNRINRNNDYNSFANSINGSLSNGEMSWLNTAQSFGLELGMVVSKKLAWHVGGEYWMKMGQNESGSFEYSSGSGTDTISTLRSEISVYGFSTGVSYYFMNPPQANQPVKNFSLFANGTIGFYHASWDLFNEYQNLNLSTSTTEGENATYTGTAPGFSFNMGVEYPISMGGLMFGAKAGYFHLNFSNVAWYNGQNEEVIASYDGTEDGRVDLKFSGVRGNIELRKYFSW